MRLYLLLLLSTIFLTFGCYKNEDNTQEPEVIIETAEVYVTTQISGSVLDDTESVISDYSIAINEEAKDIDGEYFLIEVESARKKGQTIHISKDGNKVGLKTELLVENDINHVQITMHNPYLSKEMTDVAEIVPLRKNIKADFSTFKTKELYTENVTIEYTNIDDHIALTSVGYNDLSDLLALDSRGGFYLTVNAGSGSRLSVDPDHPIILNIEDLDDGVHSLFVFDDQIEVWKLVSEVSDGDQVPVLAEGYYTLVKYAKGVFVEGSVRKEENAVAYQPMEWNHDGLSNNICGTEQGRWIALLPENEEVVVNLLNPCDESLQTESFSISNEDLEDQDIEIFENSNYQFFETEIINCQEELVAQPEIVIETEENTNHYVFSESVQNRWVAICDEYSIAAVNSETSETGPSIDWSSNIQDDLSLLTECIDFVDGFTKIKIRDDEKFYPAFTKSTIGNQTIMTSENGEIVLKFRGLSTGEYPEKQVNVLIDDANFEPKGYYISCENSIEGCGITEFNVTHLSNDFIRISFSGELWMQTLAPAVAGNFPIEGVLVSRI